jgi:RDD family
MRSASAMRRLLAIAIDATVSLLWWIPAARIQHGDGVLRLSWFGWRAAIPVAITLLYFVGLPMFAGATVGMLAMRIRTRVTPTGSSTRPEQGVTSGPEEPPPSEVEGGPLLPPPPAH